MCKQNERQCKGMTLEIQSSLHLARYWPENFNGLHNDSQGDARCSKNSINATTRTKASASHSSIHRVCMTPLSSCCCPACDRAAAIKLLLTRLGPIAVDGSTAVAVPRSIAAFRCRHQLQREVTACGNRPSIEEARQPHKHHISNK